MNAGRTGGNPWPGAIIVLVALFLVALVGSVYWGITRSSPVSDVDYYAHGVTYGRELRSQQAGGRLWAVQVWSGGGELVVHLTDRQGRAVSGADASLTLPQAGGVPGRTISLVESLAGEYRAPLPDLPPDGRTAVVELRRGEAALRRPLLLTP